MSYFPVFNYNFVHDWEIEKIRSPFTPDVNPLPQETFLQEGRQGTNISKNLPTPMSSQTVGPGFRGIAPQFAPVSALAAPKYQYLFDSQIQEIRPTALSSRTPGDFSIMRGTYGDNWVGTAQNTNHTYSRANNYYN
jgi:hypothetical protein